jgi:hypothetical protein
MTDLAPTSPEHQHTDIGSTTFVLSSQGTPLPFRPQEKRFLTAFDKTHNLEKACEEIGKPVAWGVAFFNRPKIHEWLTLIAAQAAAKNGMTVQWWFSMMLSVVLGKQTWWEGQCSTCKVKAKSYLEPDDDKGVLSSKCLACNAPVLMNLTEKPMKLDRQQMTALQELGSRISPKIERISHEFSDESYIFQPKE